MDLHNRLKKLNKLPEDQAVKSRIYERIQHKKKKGLTIWKEGVLLFTTAMIALFLILLPQNSTLPQSANQSIQTIYKYFGGEEGKFFARGSDLYTSVERVNDRKIYNFFQDLTHYVEEGDGRLGNYITDVVVVRDNQEEHYQISDTGMLNIDSGQFFVGTSDMYGEVFQLLYSVNTKPWFLILPLIVVVANLFSASYYKRRKLDNYKPPKSKWWLLLLFLSVTFGIFAWATWVGPLYKPLMLTLAVFYGVIIWYNLKRDIQHYAIYKVETIKIYIITVALVFVIMNY
ncbi:MULTISPECIES: hypothetical protein [Lysinibacillus]|uniref:hypothetical protein n=1 Tax=Lysinibacillus TaxID=400634 RepID=UPI00257F0249|nr:MULTISPECIES: hypothetical protein [Lysinibacillus]